MKRIQIAALCLLVLVGVCAGCADDEADYNPGRGHAGGSIVLRIGTGTKTRTELRGSYNLNHVRQVYAVLYEGTGDGATYLFHQDLKWSPVDSTDYGEGVVQVKELELDVPPTVKSGSEYTLLCVGLDDQSGATYGLTLDDDNETVPDFLAEGKTLADAMAILADGKSATKAELFAGWASFTYSREDENSVEVELTRRVSGAYAYVKDIPCKINGTDVKTIQLVLGNQPTSRIGLARKERSAGDLRPDDFGSGTVSDDSAKILYKLSLTDDIVEANTTTNLFNIKNEYTDALGLTEQTLFLGAYLLPMAAGRCGTLAIELLDESGILLKSFPALWNNVPTGAGDKEKYAVYPNYVYHVGTRSADTDRPASLAGERIELVVQPWTELTIATDFPKVPLEATIDYDKNQSSYIYDCINTTDIITIMPSLMRKNWKLTLVAEDKDGNEDLTGSDASFNWIYFVKPDGSYTQTLSSSDFTNGNSEAVNITVCLYDYLNPHCEKDGDKKYKYTSGYDPSVSGNWDNINKDWRRARIKIQTDNSSLTSHISIRQYNAITVIGNYDDNAQKARFSCGFSRYDYGVKRTTDGGIDSSDPTNNQGYLGKWGLLKKTYGSIYHDNTDDRTYYDGYYAHENVESKITGSSSDWGTDDISTQPVIRYSWAKPWTYSGRVVYWYLPARDELYQFFNKTVIHQPAIETNIKVGGLYWSSAAKFNSNSSSAGNRRSFCQKLSKERQNGVDGTLWMNPEIKDDQYNNRESREQLGYSRLAHHFEADYDYASMKFK